MNSREVLLQDKRSDIHPTDNGEADQLGRINMIKQSSPSAADAALDAADRRRPGFKKRTLEAEGVLEIKPSSINSEKSSP